MKSFQKQNNDNFTNRYNYKYIFIHGTLSCYCNETKIEPRHLIDLKISFCVC